MVKNGRFTAYWLFFLFNAKIIQIFPQNIDTLSNTAKYIYFHTQISTLCCLWSVPKITLTLCPFSSSISLSSKVSFSETGKPTFQKSCTVKEYVVDWTQSVCTIADKLADWLATICHKHCHHNMSGKS